MTVSIGAHRKDLVRLLKVASRKEQGATEMIVSPNELRKETVQLVRLLDEEIELYHGKAQRSGMSPFRISNDEGQYKYGELVTAKLSAINTLAILNEPRKK